MRTRRRVLGAVSGMLLLGAQAAAAQACADHDHHDQEPARLAVVREATDRYHNLAKAEANGYAILADVDGLTCIDQPGVGGMGVHYVNGDLVGDPAIHARKPEALVYRPTASGALRLAAVEYVVIASAWDAGHSEAPSLFGQMFMLTPSPNRYGLPPFYSLHVWVWDDNPSGTFAMYNPDVVCP